MSTATEVTTPRFAEWLDQAAVNAQASLEANPDDTQQWSIQFDVLLDDWVIGTDEAVLWFDDNFLYVAGKRTSFAIPGHRISEPLRYKSKPFKPLERTYTLELGCPAGQIPSNQKLAIQFDTGIAPPFTPEKIALETAVLMCRAMVRLDLEGQLPPVSPAATAHDRKLIIKTFYNSVVAPLVLALILVLGVSLVFERLRLNLIFATLIVLIILFQVMTSMVQRVWLNYLALRSLNCYSRSSHSQVR